LPADGRSRSELTFGVADRTRVTLTLWLRGCGSFDPHIRRSRITVPVQEGEARVIVYAPGRPGSARVCAEGFQHRLNYRPAGAGQKLLYDWLPTLVFSLMLALLLRGYAFASFFIPSPSMEGTLKIGDRLIAEKYSFQLFNSPAQRGDIILFHPPQEPGEVWIKRCIGLPGDSVKARDGVVYVNGEPLDEGYIAEPPHMDFGPVVVPSGHYFVMGDNRNNSTDSRSWGPLPEENLIGRAVVVVWPPEHAQLLTNPLSQTAHASEPH
jgi:signal peptidase I